MYCLVLYGVCCSCVVLCLCVVCLKACVCFVSDVLCGGVWPVVCVVLCLCVLLVCTRVVCVIYGAMFIMCCCCVFVL